MTTAKTDAFIFLLGWIDFWWEGIKIWWGGGEWANFWLVGDSPIPPVGKPCINFANRFLSTMKKLRAHHIHHVPKWPSYFCKIWALCVSHTYMVYIFTCLFRIFTTINLSHHGHIWSGPMKEEVFLKRVSLINSLNIIKHTFAWRNKFVVYIYILYIGQTF